MWEVTKLNNFLKKFNQNDINPDAMGILAWRYRTGTGVEKDEKLAQHYAEMESNVEPFDLPDNDDSNPWMQGKTIEV